MKKRKLDMPVNQKGFIPMLLSIIGIILFVIYLVYTRVVSMSS